MNCQGLKDLIFLYAADQLEQAEMEELRQHLATGCPTCAGQLAEAQATLAQVSASLDPIAPRPDTFGTLMARIGVTPATDANGETNRTGRNDAINATNMESAPTYPRLAPASSRGNVSVEFESASTQIPAIAKERNETHLGKQQTGRTGFNRWRLFGASLLSAAAAVAITSAVFLQKQRDAMMIYPWTNVQTVSLSSEAQPGARADVVWDRDNNRWRISVFNLAPPPKGREFELWFITPDGAKHPSKTFGVDAKGAATMVVSVPTDIGPIALAAITDEPMGGLPEPTGQIHLVGKVQ